MHNFEGSKVKKSIILIPIALKYKTATELLGLREFRNFISTNYAIQKQKRLIAKSIFICVYCYVTLKEIVAALFIKLFVVLKTLLNELFT